MCARARTGALGAVWVGGWGACTWVGVGEGAAAAGGVISMPPIHQPHPLELAVQVVGHRYITAAARGK